HQLRGLQGMTLALTLHQIMRQPAKIGCNQREELMLRAAIAFTPLLQEDGNITHVPAPEYYRLWLRSIPHRSRRGKAPARLRADWHQTVKRSSRNSPPLVYSPAQISLRSSSNPATGPSPASDWIPVRCSGSLWPER